MNGVEQKLIEAITAIVKEKFDLVLPEGFAMIEIPKEKINGDYSTNVAMRLTKLVKGNPRLIAEQLKEALLARNDEIEKIEIAGPGFINFWMKKSALADIINTVLTLDDKYGCSDVGKGVKVLEEYVSANPTGSLHFGHARGAAWGDSCVRIMNAAGFKATREYYINDAGAQITNLGKSIEARYRELFGLDFELPEDGYHGKDVIEIAQQIKDRDGDRWLRCAPEETLEAFKTLGREIQLERIKQDLKDYGCEFDSWISELAIVKAGKVEDAVKRMDEKGLLYEKDGAIWFRSSQYGDDKDRVLRKSDGLYTYMTPDIANHIYKYERGYDVLVNIWGADHHGYISRMKAALEALGYSRDNLQVDICQMVRMVENGVEVKMSKRTGNAITLRELMDDIGTDAARYNFLSKALETQMDFDLSLARSQSNDNPVFYAQYAYARICSVLRQANYQREMRPQYDQLTHEKELDLLKHIASFTDMVADAAINRAPNKVCNYIQKLATYYHSFYGALKINDPANPEQTAQRLALCEATRVTLRNALNLLGVSAPEHMSKE